MTILVYSILIIAAYLRLPAAVAVVAAVAAAAAAVAAAAAAAAVAACVGEVLLNPELLLRAVGLRQIVFTVPLGVSLGNKES